MTRNFWKLWSAAAISNLGDGVRVTALPLLAASITRDPAQIAAVSAAVFLPWLLFALVGGAVVDRVDKRVLMRDVQLLRMVVMAALAAAVVTGTASIAVIFAVAFMVGTGEVLVDTAAQAMVPVLVPDALLESANGRLAGAELVANHLAGPPLGGLLFGLSRALPFGLDALSFGVGAGLLHRLEGRFRAERQETRGTVTVWKDIREGLGWLWRHRLLRALAAIIGIVNMGNMVYYAIFVLFALEILQLPGVGFGVLLGVQALGGLVGTALASRLVSVVGRGRAMFLGLLLSGLAPVAIGLSSSPPVAGGLLFLVGFSVVVVNVVGRSLRQSLAPDRLLGRVTASFRLVGYGTIPLGAALGGLLARAAGLRAPFLIGGGLVALAALAMLPLVNDRTIALAKAEAG